ncbi:hypothetical protein NDU88_007101 [Pleurodeles waltl]|uniref:Uncharacterized protein n=1 Tax=Pleurodeles waltl TaxID=8319 RepID=A0AAV7UNF5_PLEWA|nr:hypothetical protein NDU88_007101 [Pleurodeles waltl]
MQGAVPEGCLARSLILKLLCRALEHLPQAGGLEAATDKLQRKGTLRCGFSWNAASGNAPVSGQMQGLTTGRDTLRLLHSNPVGAKSISPLCAGQFRVLVQNGQTCGLHNVDRRYP